MTMLTAAEILSRHPQGCWVFDATGRRLANVFACDPTTGEAVIWCQAPSPLAWLVGLLPRPRPTWPWLYRSEIPRRHGFWPAPLHIVPKPVWNGDPEQYAPVPRRSAAEREVML
jgi:hypothetical protein